jgi:hypothetical protein
MGVNSNMSQKKIIATTDNSKWEAPKKRKPMTEEQKKAASERLAKARATKLAKNPDYGNAGVHSSVRELIPEHTLHPEKVKNWIKTQKDLAKVQRISVRQNIKGAAAKLAIHEGYVRNMQNYLRTGDWVDDFYGEYQQSKVKKRCVALAYYWYGPKKGQPKRTVGVLYPDLGYVWTEEMDKKDY